MGAGFVRDVFEDQEYGLHPGVRNGVEALVPSSAAWRSLICGVKPDGDTDQARTGRLKHVGRAGHCGAERSGSRGHRFEGDDETG